MLPASSVSSSTWTVWKRPGKKRKNWASAPLFLFDFSEDELKILGWNYTKYLEYFLDPEKTDNTMFLISDFQTKE